MLSNAYGRKKEKEIFMDLTPVMQLIGLGFIVTAACQMLTRAGRDDQATYVSIGGIVIALLLLLGKLGELIELLSDMFML